MKNKQTQKNSKKNVKNEKLEHTAFFSLNKLLFLSSILVMVTSYYVYNLLTSSPVLPKVDLNTYWGPYPMNHKPDLSIRDYKIEFTDVMINDLRERLLHRRPFPPPLEDSGFTYGFNSHFLERVLDYWQNKYNFKEREKYFNKYNHYITNIQGLDIHFIHVKPNVSADVKIIPILLMHGWPGSVAEFNEIIAKLVTPRAGYKFVFEVIAPSLPGFGFSQAPARSGFNPVEMAVVMANLMKRIGHSQYYVQGGDVGHVVGSILATLFPQNILGFHTNFPTTLFSLRANLYVMLGSLWPRLLIEPELESRMYPWTDYVSFQVEESGYLHLQATKPDTIGIALTDSPAGLAAYILEKFSTWTNRANKKASDGNLLGKFTLTQLLDNVMVYWSTDSITTSMRTYAETMNKKFLGLRLDDIPTEAPTWGIKFKHELAFQPDCVLRLKYKNYLHSTVVEDGGHFAALEHPDLLADDMFLAIDTFQQFHNQGLPQEQNNQSSQINYETAETIYEFSVKDIHGRDVQLDKYRGHVVLIVNVASRCGLTDNNYKQLNELYDKYQSRGLRILAFPCNQFNSQEPGSPADILQFTKERGVKFDIFQKVEVNGENAHPLWKFLKRAKSGTLGDFIKWNFSKFIIDKNGVPVERLGPNVNPMDLEPNLEKYL